jgi:hypothetical protein
MCFGRFHARRWSLLPAAVRFCALGSVLVATGCTQPPRSIARPGPRTGHNLVFDAAAGRTLLLFGYSDGALPARSEIWAWKGGSWSIVDRAGPGFRSLAGVAADDAGRRVLLFGGAGPGYRSRYGDTWSWTAAGWRELVGAGPGPVDHHTVAYDVRRRALIVFGGNDPKGGWVRATWALDSAGWRVVPDSLGGPPPRAHHAMVYDVARERVVLFGGLAEDRRYLDDTWEWDGARWRRIDVPGPPARTRHRLAYDAARGVVVLYGGSGTRPAGQSSGFNLLSDTWEYDGRGWRAVDAGAGPGPRMVHAMSYDASVGETLLFGGSDGSANRDDLWSWNGRRWLRR